MSVLFALAAACFFAGVGIAAKRGVQHNSIVTALVVSLPVGALVMLLFALFDLPETVSSTGIGLFVAAGFIGEGVGRTSFILAVQRIGPSTATPIQTASYPVLALVGGFLLFSETVTPLRVMGAVSIVAGIWALVGGEGTRGGAVTADRRTRGGRWAYLLPVVGGLAFASSDIVRKLGLVEIPFPAFGALVGNVTIVAVWALVIALVPRVRNVARPGRWMAVVPAYRCAGGSGSAVGVPGTGIRRHFRGRSDHHGPAARGGFPVRPLPARSGALDMEDRHGCRADGPGSNPDHD